MSEVQAVAPEFLSLQVEDTEVRVQAYDSGVRNAPYFAALVSVRRSGDKLHFAGNPRAGLDESRLRTEGLMVLDVRDKDKGSPYYFALARKDWPDAELVLLLLGYLQPRGIGGTTRPRAKGLSPPPRQPPMNVPWEEVKQAPVNVALKAVEQALAADGVNELRSGLITGKPRSWWQGSTSERREIKFVLASCHYPSDFLDYMPTDEQATRGPADSSLLHLNDLLGKDDAPILLLLAGDQVYVDSTAGLFDPKAQDDRFRLPYESRGRSRGIMAVMQRLDLRVETMLDDHEIGDNWEPNDPPEALDCGMESYFIFQRGFRPPFPKHTWPCRTWRCIDHDGIPFFLGDTRTERQGRTALNWRTAEIMSSEQFSALLKCIKEDKNAGLPKFVLTTSRILPRGLNVARDAACALHSDGWEGYPHSQHQLLQFVFDNEVKGLVLLSGDDHICSLTKATISRAGTNKTSVLYSIHSSGLYSPYPFANAKPNDFASPDKFMFPNPRKGPYCCEVETHFADERDGFTLVSVRPKGQDWELEVTFHSAEGAKPNQPARVRLF